MKNFKYIKLFVVAVALSVSSCNSVLDQEPQAALSSETAFKNRADIEAGIVGAYSGLQSANYLGLRYFLFSDLQSGNLAHTGTFPSFAQLVNQAVLPDNVELNNIWNQIYDCINRTNNIIDAAPKIEDPAFSNKEALIAEARALRAFHYFNLINYWGGAPSGFGIPSSPGVPLWLTPTKAVADAAAKPRSTEGQVIEQVLADLNAAIEKLPASYGAATATKGRITKNAAQALKSRVLLYQKKYQEAADAAALVTGTLVANYGDIYSAKNTAESIWELQFDPTNSNSIAFFYFPTTAGGRNEVSPAAGLGSAHEAGDVRRNVNVATAPAGTTTKYSRIASSDDHVVLIRFAEVLLNRAEALARIGGVDNLTEAVTLLNRIRTRAGLPSFVSVSQSEIISAILKERRVELAHEGHYWFDLRRTGTTRVAIPAVTEDFRVLWPVPQREVLTSGNIVVQNAGY